MFRTNGRNQELHQSKAAGQTVLLDMGVYQTDRSGPLPKLVTGPDVQDGVQDAEAVPVTADPATIATDMPSRPRRLPSVGRRTRSECAPSKLLNSSQSTPSLMPNLPLLRQGGNITYIPKPVELRSLPIMAASDDASIRQCLQLHVYQVR